MVVHRQDQLAQARARREVKGLRRSKKGQAMDNNTEQL